MRRLLLACLTLLALAVPAAAASRFWNPYSVTGAISGTAGVCRLTISPAIVGGGLVAGDTVITTSIGGATGCTTTATISTVVDTTHIELTGTTFGGAYTSGGCVAGGHWTTTNTANWAASSTATCGSGGQTVPSTADGVTLDANSLGGTIIPAASFNTISSLTMGAFTGTLDFSVNNPSFTMGFLSNSNTGTRTLNCGTGTWTLNTLNSNPIDMTTTTGLTLSCTANTFLITPSSAPTGARTILLGGKTIGTVTLSALSVPSKYSTTVTPASGGTINTLTVNGPNTTFNITNGQTLTMTDFTFAGSKLGLLQSSSPSSGNTTLTITNAPTISAAALVGVTFTNAATATSSYDLGGNTNVTITNPSGGGGLVSN